MKVVVLGGYGVFGSLLAKLLVRDGHTVWVAGRDLVKAKAWADRIDARPLRVDLFAEPQRIFETAPDVVIDAAGPFQLYGDDPYRIPRLCIDHGADYLDLSDSAEFTQGISKLNQLAQSRGRRVLSGASSVPGLSSAVVSALARNISQVLLIETAILPGNRAPRGKSVISSILGQVGRGTQAWRGGVWRQQRGWSNRRTYTLGPGMRRTAYFLNVPDIVLFPAFFHARSVLFRAGMELRVLNAAMSFLSRLRRRWNLAIPPLGIDAIQWLSNRFLPFGTDRGGMLVAVTGVGEGPPIRRTWRLIAEAGEGPFVPGIVVRTLLRQMQRVRPGARPCLSEIPLVDIEDAMSDLAITTETTEQLRPTLFQAALADRWVSLPPEVQTLHSVQDTESFSGTARIDRGNSVLARCAAWFFRFPCAGENVPLTVTKTRTEKGEIWERNFDGRVFRSYLTPATELYRYRERFWLFNYEQDLPVSGGEMHLPVRRGWFLGIPIPRPFLPDSKSREYAKDGQFHFDVALSAPLGLGLIVRYRGRLTPDR